MKQVFTTLRLLLALVLAAPAARAQTAVDQTFLPEQIYQPAYLSQALQLGDGSRVVVGGNHAEGQPTAGLVRYLPSGQLDATFLANTRANIWAPSALTEAPGNKLLFWLPSATVIGGQLRAGVVRLNTNGTLDASFAALPALLTTPQNYQRSLLVQPNGQVLAGGGFTRAGSLLTPGLLRLNPDGTIDQAFQTQLSASLSAGNVTALAQQADGRLLVGGNFTLTTGPVVRGVLRLNADGSLDPTFTSPTMPAGANVTSLAWQPDGKILAVGTGRFVGSQSAASLVRLNANGSLDNTFASAVSNVPSPFRGGPVLQVQPDGRILVATIQVMSVARLLSTGATDPSWSAPAFGRGDTNSIQLLANGQVLFAGSAKRLTSATALPTGVGLLNATGSLDPSFQPMLQQPGGVQMLVRQPDGKILITGAFSEINGTAVRNLARLQSDGTLDVAFSTNCPLAGSDDNFTAKLALQPDGKVLVGGTFTQAGSQPAQGLVRLLPSGQPDPSFTSPFVASTPTRANQVLQLALQPDGQVLVFGLLRLTSSTTVDYNFVRVSAQGVLDNSFQPITDHAYVGALLVQPDGNILVGASYSTAAGYLPLVRLLPSGQSDPSFTPPVIPATAAYPPYVQTLTRYPDGRLLVGGDFDDYGPVTSPGLVRLSANGVPDASFQSGLSTNSGVYSVLVQPNQRLLVAGFINLTTTSSDVLGRLLPDGAIDYSFVSVFDPTTYPFIRSLDQQPDGGLLVGGEFVTAGSQDRIGIVRVIDANVLRVAPSASAATLEAWPVPTHGTLHLRLSAADQPRQLSLLDAQGRPVLSQSITQPELSLDTRQLPPGTYLLRISYTGSAPVTRRIVLE